MSNATIQSALQTIIRGNSNFSDADVTLGDARLIDAGAPPYCVIFPGRLVESEFGYAYGEMIYTWDHNVYVYDRFTGDDYGDITTLRDSVIATLGQNFRLGQTDYTRAIVNGIGEIVGLFPEGGAEIPTFVIAPFTVRVMDHIDHSGGGDYP